MCYSSRSSSSVVLVFSETSYRLLQGGSMASSKEEQPKAVYLGFMLV